MRLRLGLPLIVSILLFAGPVSAQEGAEAGEPLRFARFADIRLYKAVSEELREMQIYRVMERDLQELTKLNAKGLGISDLTGLEHATNLRKLDLSGNRITDVSPLVGLTHLIFLRLEGNEIRDISPLSPLKNLASLILNGNSIVDISPLVALTDLRGLKLEGNEIRDISPLSPLKNLTHLFLNDNGISDVSLLATLRQLTWLELNHNAIVDVSPLTGLTQLEYLELGNNRISDISPLTALRALEDLELRGNPLAAAAVDVHIPAIAANGTDVRYGESAGGITDIKQVSLSDTVRGEIVEVLYEFPIEDVRVVLQAQDGTEYTTTAEYGNYEFRGIPAGRYLLSIHKKGYHDRIGKPVTIVKGGNHYLPLKMVEMDSLLTGFRRLLIYILLLCGITALITFSLTKRWMAARLRS